MLDMFEESGRILRAITEMKQSQPGRALQLIGDAFRATRFGSRDYFDSLDEEELRNFVIGNKMEARSLEFVIDLLTEEIDIRIKEDDIPVLIQKTALLITLAEEKDAAQKVFSFRRGLQRSQLQALLKRRND